MIALLQDFYLKLEITVQFNAENDRMRNDASLTGSGTTSSAFF